MVIARSLVTKIEGELARWPRRKCLFLRYFAASGLSRSWLCSAVKMRGLSGSIPHAPAPASSISLCVRMAEQADNRHERRLRFQRHIQTGVPSGTDHHIATGEEIGGEQNIPLLQQLLVNQPVKVWRSLS